MSKERARRRELRESEAAKERNRRARRRARVDRRQAWGRSLRRLVPSMPKTTPGLLAQRRRRRLAVMAGGIAVICLIAWPLMPSWGARLILLVFCLLCAPVVWVMSFGRV